MISKDIWKIRARWQQRSEQPSDLATRICKFVTNLEKSSTIIRSWYHWETESNCINILDDPGKAKFYISNNVSHDEYGTETPNFGYRLQINNTPSDVTDTLTLMCRMDAGSSVTFNGIDIDTPYGIDPDPYLLQYSNYKDLVLAIASAFEPDFICVYPTAMPKSNDSDTKFYGRVPLISEGWMLYLSPPIATEAKVPPSLIQETYRDGGLFLAATDETFDYRNMEHRKQVFLMEEMLDPLNRVTWRSP